MYLHMNRVLLCYSRHSCMGHHVGGGTMYHNNLYTRFCVMLDVCIETALCSLLCSVHFSKCWWDSRLLQNGHVSNFSYSISHGGGIWWNFFFLVLLLDWLDFQPIILGWKDN